MKDWSITGAAALDRLGRNDERIRAELPEGSVQLLVDLAEPSQRFSVGPQGVRYRPRVELIDEDAAIVLVGVLKAHESEHGRSGIRVIRPRRVVVAVSHAQPT